MSKLLGVSTYYSEFGDPGQIYTYPNKLSVEIGVNQFRIIGISKREVGYSIKQETDNNLLFSKSFELKPSFSISSFPVTKTLPADLHMPLALKSDKRVYINTVPQEVESTPIKFNV